MPSPKPTFLPFQKPAPKTEFPFGIFTLPPVLLSSRLVVLVIMGILGGIYPILYRVNCNVYHTTHNCAYQGCFPIISTIIVASFFANIISSLPICFTHFLYSLSLRLINRHIAVSCSPSLKFKKKNQSLFTMKINFGVTIQAEKVQQMLAIPHFSNRQLSYATHFA